MQKQVSRFDGFPFIVRLNMVDCITLSSVVTTAIAVACALDHQTYLATALLFVAATADALDGMLARKLGLARQFGRYLDGFMDVLIYLVSPAIVAHQTGFDGWWGLFLILMIGSGCVRLAVFNEVGNIETDGKLQYLGMPVFWSVFIVAAYQLALLRWSELLCHALLALTLALFALLMVIQRPFFKFSSLAQILFLTIGAMLVFLLLDFSHRGIVLPHLPWHTVLWLQFSVVMGGVLHMVVVRTNALRVLKIPLHDHWFGANKTLRGFVVMPLLTAIGAIVPAQVHPAMEQPMWLQAQGVVGWLLLGACLGLAYVVAELPNSFIKRRKGIPPGISPQRARVWFVAADQLDSALGMSLTLALLGFTWIQCMLFMMTFPVTAIIVKQLLFKFKLKQTAL